jgi:hypothetical protein
LDHPDAGDPPAAFFLKLDAVLQHALVVLRDSEILEGSVVFASDDGDDRWDAAVEACVNWLERQDDPDPNLPRSAEAAAAYIVVRASDLRELLAEFGLEAFAGRIAFDVMAEALTVAAELGSLAETFRADMGGFLDASQRLAKINAQRQAGSRKGSETNKKKADDAWRNSVLSECKRVRSGHLAHYGQKALAGYLFEKVIDPLELKSPPSLERVVAQIAEWERADEIPRSSKHPKKGRPPP